MAVRVLIAAVALALLAVVAVVALQRDGTDPVADGPLTATPVTSANEAGPVPAQRPPSTPTPDPGGTAADVAGAADVAAAVQAVTPEGATSVRSAAADLNGDGLEDVVVASLLGGRSRIDVATGAADGFSPVYGGEGGSAQAVADLVLQDLDGAPETLEVVVLQTSGAQGRSASLWRLSDSGWAPMAAADGCWEGSHTFGIVGVEVSLDGVLATCDGSPAPIISWPSDRYVWSTELEAFAHVETLRP